MNPSCVSAIRRTCSGRYLRMREWTRSLCIWFRMCLYFVSTEWFTIAKGVLGVLKDKCALGVGRSIRSTGARLLDVCISAVVYVMNFSFLFFPGKNGRLTLCPGLSSRLSYGCLLLFFGRLGDIVGGRLMFILGSCWFAIWYAPSISASSQPN